MIIFRLSGEHPSLPVEEIKALYEAYGKRFTIASRDGSLLLAESGPSPRILERLAFTHEFYTTNKVTDAINLNRVLLGLNLKKDETFCVRCLGFPDNAAEERLAGEVIYENKRIKVDLMRPDKTVFLIKVGRKVAISLKRYETDDFNKRDPNDRPFFHPLALNPKLARLFLNLARLKEGDTVLDPFCGSGSILIEASLMGLKAIGTDMDRRMLQGCARNLAFYGLKAESWGGDARDIRLRKLDAIVTDPPYARASKIYSESLKSLYDDFLSSASKAIKPGGRMVLAVPHDAPLSYKKHGFEEICDHLLYVHRSLTRRVFVLKKPK